jgi:hypothetical protein
MLLLLFFTAKNVYKITYSSTIYHQTTFQDPILSGSIAVLSSEICTVIMFVLFMRGNYNTEGKVVSSGIILTPTFVMNC